MNIRIKQLKLVNFKGIRELVIDFGDITNINGANGTGKTTIVDAFNWLMWGKNSIGQKDFNVKTLDTKNQPIHKLEHEVSAILLVDGKEEVPKRMLKEMWVKKRGEAEAVFSGHETTYFWNDVPMKASEYQAKIGSIINEELFKLLSNTGYFNSQKWQDQRSILCGIAGDVLLADVIESIATPANDYGHLINILNSGKSLEDYKKEIGVKKKKIKDEADQIPARLAEVKRNLPEPKDYAAIEKNIKEYEQLVFNVDKRISDAVQAQKDSNAQVLSKQRELHEAKQQQSDITFKVRQQITNKYNEKIRTVSDIESKIKDNEAEITLKNKSIEAAEEMIRQYQSRIDSNLVKVTELRKQWENINAEEFTFDPAGCTCPTCKQQLPETELLSREQELKTNFNESKSARLNECKTQGTAINAEIDKIKADISAENKSIEQVKKDLETCKANIATIGKELSQAKAVIDKNVNIDAEVSDQLAENDEYLQLKNRIEELEAIVSAQPSQDTDTTLSDQRKKIQNDLDNLRVAYANKAIEANMLDRIKELEKQERELAQELANLEKSEFDINTVTRAKMDLIEARINQKFQYVQFKMYDRQINGGEVECCEALINGVPFSDANTASKINAGLDIINTLSLVHGVSVPVFIDNRESVSDIITTSGQIINLFVSPSHKTLSIS